MEKICMTICIVTAILFAAGNALSQDYMIYPKEGQSAQQIEQDKFECYSWAKQQSGFDPMQAQAVPAPESQQEESSRGKKVLRGGAGGAAIGAGIGAIAGDAGKGAAIGAVAGGAGSAVRDRRKQQETQEQQAQQTSQSDQQRQNYNRAFEACMEGKGYTVK